MKKSLLVFAISFSFLACKDESQPASTASTTQPSAAVAIPVTYSSSFEIGNAAHAKMIVEGSWMDWQNNKLDNMKNWLADSAVIMQSNGKTITGVDSIVANWKRSRAKYTNVVDSVNAVTTLRSIDKKEDWVLVWATDYSTATDGKKDSIEIMETWRINKAGKADLLLQYDRHTRKQ